MKRRWKTLLALTCIAVFATFLLWQRDPKELDALEKTRRTLRAQGFKTELSEFDFSTTDELRARTAALTNATILAAPSSSEEAERRNLLQYIQPDLLPVIGANAAVPIWRQDKLRASENAFYQLQAAGHPGDNVWPLLRDAYAGDRVKLDAATDAILAGPIRFHLNASQGSGILLPHLAGLKYLSQTLGGRTMLELRDGNKENAWTNLLAVTRLVTAWTPEPTDISSLVRFACVAIAYNALWQGLQTDGWSDSQLATLQRDWESAEFFAGLPETAAFTRVSAVTTCQLERQEPLNSSFLFNEFFRSPRSAWANLQYYRQQLHYRKHGTYADEEGLLRFYRDREEQLQRAVKCPTWSEMRQLPGVTNLITFQSKHSSGMQVMLNQRQLSLSWQMYNSPGEGQGLLGRAAGAESRRRLIVTAIALERFRGQNGTYPQSLHQLVPRFLKSQPVDFMDGQPMRYRLTEDHHFVLYSVGLDCVDNGGVMHNRAAAGGDSPLRVQSRIPKEADLLWPRPASAADIETHEQEQLVALAEQTRRLEDAQAAEQWRQTALRQTRAERLLAAKPSGRAEPAYRGRSLSGMLRNRSAVGTNALSFNELLTLKQVITGSEPEIVTFEAPIDYDTLTNIGGLRLLVDADPRDDYDDGYQVGAQGLARATNGNSLLLWNTIFESPGKHALQIELELEAADSDTNSLQPKDSHRLLGPVAPYVISNLCQFSVGSAYFKPELGATLQANLPESNALYSIEITSPAGALLKTLTGATTNGIISVHWDLIDDKGNRCTNQSFNTVFRITLSASGRTQTLKGP